MGKQGWMCRYGVPNELTKAEPDDTVIESNGVKVSVDSDSIPYLEGSTLDYSDDLNDSGFKLLNPNASEAVDVAPHLSQLIIQTKSITHFPVSTGKERNGYGDQKSNLASLFWWSLTISTLSALVVLSWVSSIYIFNNPSEKILIKF